MINRKAVLIGNSGGYRSLKLLKGVKIDIENYQTFLKSSSGGQWYENEIITLNEPDSERLINTIANIKSDYCFVAFCGHGQINSFTKQDYICLKDQDVYINNLVSKSDRQTIVLDVCRNIETNLPEIDSTFLTENLPILNESNTTRNIYDNAIEKTPKGIILVYSTLPFESGSEDIKRGGHFTYSLIKAGYEWGANKKNGILSLDLAIEMSELIMKNTFTSNQKPIMGGQVRRLTFPPFACSRK